MTTNETTAKKPRTRKGVSDKSLYKHIKESQNRFDLGDTNLIGELLDKLKDAVMDDVLS